MSEKMTIPEIKKAIDDLQKDIARECNENHGNCQACFYERRCSDEVSFYVRQLKAEYCKQAGHDCSLCEYTKECDTPEARAEIRRQKHQKQLDTCAALGSDCTRCEYFAYHCSFKKGDEEWHKFVEKCCTEPDGCLRCPASRLCSNEKCSRILD